MLIRYSRHELELTEGALEMRYPGGVMPIGYADGRAIRFVVGSAEKRSHIDMMDVVGSAHRIRITSRFAHPDGIRESRALYRKFVRELLKRIAEARGTPTIRIGGYPPVVAQRVRAAGGIGLVLIALLFMVVSPPDRATLLCLVIPSALALGAGIFMVRNPEELIDLETAREIAVPPRGAE